MGEACTEMQLLIQADVDGELAPADSARVGAHVETCSGCAETQARLLALSRHLRREALYHPASDALRAAVRAQIAISATAEEPEPVAARAASVRASWWRLPRRPLRSAAPFGAGFALAACLVLALVLPQGGGGLPDAAVADHIRALQPGHLTDVTSTDQHTVKPWFNGRLDYAPPVKDFKASGFPLIGGRLDYLGGQPVAVLVYERRKHLIDLFVRPADGYAGREPTKSDRNGFNVLHWSRDGMAFWAVSDLNAEELADFARLWQTN